MRGINSSREGACVLCMLPPITEVLTYYICRENIITKHQKRVWPFPCLSQERVMCWHVCRICAPPNNIINMLFVMATGKSSSCLALNESIMLNVFKSTMVNDYVAQPLTVQSCVGCCGHFELGDEQWRF